MPDKHDERRAAGQTVALIVLNLRSRTWEFVERQDGN